MQVNYLLNYFQIYSKDKAPFLHKQLSEWHIQQPLSGLNVLHHVPLVPNTLLKIACLVAAGANVVVTNPSFTIPNFDSIAALKQDDILFVENISTLQGKSFDIYFDCGAELYQRLGPPKLGAIELTASGIQFYRSQQLIFPVINIDHTLLKQLETVFGASESIPLAITQLTHQNLLNKSWLVFGFGKIGRGLGFYCTKQKLTLIVADINPNARLAAQSLGIKAIDPYDHPSLKKALAVSDIIITATGKKSILKTYPKEWFDGKILANMGILDEFGNQFSKNEVLNNKLPVNFILKDPTPMPYIDPEFYAHNLGALELLNRKLNPGVYNFPKELDQQIVHDWCEFHKMPKKEIMKWFINTI